MSDISRWLGTFDVKFASEKISRNIAAEWVGPGLIVELAPLMTRVTWNKELTVILKPWAYMYNLVGHVIHRLDALEKEKC